ncbi:hypothetical protein [Acidovorax sp. NCPPB 3576]|uniref:hypothetical protein n=1 Tax=Acidovorax sp. NCPPB 3576 TaxID=2940488 RepID=UPI00234B1505|nr:hypothetical protein [Acidovorax sp. NCPPB 3576]WCM88525.1 hypothetical protein M5C98_00215 [Acidovorax sp. NCPPB 3576]
MATAKRSTPNSVAAGSTADTQGAADASTTPTEGTPAAQDASTAPVAQTAGTAALDTPQTRQASSGDGPISSDLGEPSDSGDLGGVPAVAGDPPVPGREAFGMRTYIVGSVPIRHNGRVYGVGYDIELWGAEAQRLAGLVIPIPEGATHVD